MKTLFDVDGILKRGKNLDRKNGMFVYLLNKLPKIESVIELYAGYGMQTYYIQKMLQTKVHDAYELNYDRFKFLTEKFPNVVTYNMSSEHLESQNYDLCIADGYCFTKKSMAKDLELLKKTGAKYHIVTNTGIFHAKFEEGGYTEYITRLKDRLKNEGLTTISIVYCGNYGLMLMSSGSVSSNLVGEVKKWTKEIKDTSWRGIFCDKNTVI